ncbi:MAG: hypothetical protein COV48_16870, partial [Elusimicrobia bacterium CG11_big_fil_rev_8_21_14_0_20_64_6]
YNAEACARSLHRALLADEEEKTRRMKEMRKVVKSQNVFSWAGELLETTSEIWRERKHDVGFGHGVAHFDAPAKSKTAPLLQSFAP